MELTQAGKMNTTWCYIRTTSRTSRQAPVPQMKHHVGRTVLFP